MEIVHVYSGFLALTCAILSAKWAMDQGLSLIVQAIWGLAGLFLGPLALGFLYLRFLSVKLPVNRPAQPAICHGETPLAIGCETPILAIAHKA